jgi:hypothetical protein
LFLHHQFNLFYAFEDIHIKFSIQFSTGLSKMINGKDLEQQIMVTSLRSIPQTVSLYHQLVIAQRSRRDGEEGQQRLQLHRLLSVLDEALDIVTGKHHSPEVPIDMDVRQGAPFGFDKQ